MELLRLRFDEQVRSEKRKSDGTAVGSSLSQLRASLLFDEVTQGGTGRA